MIPEATISFRGVKQNLDLRVGIQLPSEMSEKEALIFIAGMLSTMSQIVNDLKTVNASELKEAGIIFQEVKS